MTGRAAGAAGVLGADGVHTVTRTKRGVGYAVAVDFAKEGRMPKARKPIIGVVPLVDKQRDSYWMLPGYFEGVIEAGGVPVMLPLSDDETTLDQALSACDGLLITGGQDVSPAVYGEKDPATVALVGETSPERDVMEAALLPRAIENDLPVLGICRGIQVINALLGGTLWQDLPAQHPSAVEHHGKPPYDAPVHTVEVLPKTPLAAAISAGEHAVNSYHHQAVRELAPGLQAMAVSPDGLVEALWRPESRFLWAVQWHPEFAHRVDKAARQIFSAFVDAAAGE